ncbi:MAG TPA: uracil-DNA glycosylase family protein [Balneolales bacterium]|nr:uracil-DNA glycosylase family protein [Balneolales bacterium]
MHRENATSDELIMDFYYSLNPDFEVPEDVEIMNPFEDPSTADAARRFYKRFYHDKRPRIFLFGINPGRFGAGVTGVPFTDPIRLQEICGIENVFDKKPELSSQFVYEVIDEYEGPENFYRDFFISAVCPLGFTRDGKNLNYYDDNNLEEAAEPFIVRSIRKQLDIFDSQTTCFSLGKGKNFKYFAKLNNKHHFFEKIIPLPHPRWVMQYRRKKMKFFIHEYVTKLQDAAV